MSDQLDPLDNPANPPTLYIPEWSTEHDADGPMGERIAWRQATAEEIGKAARVFEETFRDLLTKACSPIPVRVTWAGRNRLETELHARNNCEHVWGRGEPRVHFHTTQLLYLIGAGKVERGELEEEG